jgi:hypothetical protein
MEMSLVRILGVQKRLVQDAHCKVIVLVRWKRRRRMLEDGWGLPHDHMSFLVIIILEMRS